MNYFTKERINRICDDLKRLININETPITHWSIKKGGFINPGDADLDKTKWEEFSCADDVLQAQDSHYWLKTIVTIPKNFDKKTIWLKIGTQIDFWDAVNPQFLLFINGEPAQGFDTNHRTCIVCENAVASQQITLELQAYTGTNSDQTSCDTSRLNLYSSIFEQDEEINALYYDLAVPLNVLNQLDTGSLDYINIVKILNKAINILDLREPYSPEFYTSVNDCRLFLQKEMYENTQTKNEVTASCVGHTHIDIAWWWTVAQTRQKVCRSFATVLKLMEQYPDYKFMSSQPQLYKFVKERHPKMFEEIKKRVSEGRWEVEGGMWVEADCNVTSGESLIRQFLHGKKFFKDEFHKDNVILWLPDVFGYSAALPQIMKKCGIKYFMTTKIAWNQFNKFPFDTFWWRGIDSTEIFTHLITTQDENQSPESFATTYNGKLTPVCVMKAWERYQQKDINKNVLISYGYGDGGGGPTREMLECAKRMDGAIPGTPRVKLTTAREYFDKIYSDLQENKDVPRWVGELYLEYHRGTYTSMARNKKSNRQCEFLWQDAEFFCVLAWLFGKKYPHEKIYDSWETILLNQFHDILPGSSIKEVYEVTKIEYEQLYKSGQKLIGDTVASLAKNIKGEKGDIVVFNTLSFEKDEIVEVDELLCCSLKGEGDSAICVQKSYDGKSLFVAKNLPPKGYSVFKAAAEVIPEPACVSVFQNTITTKFYIITLDENMRFTSIYDRENDREVLKDGSLGNVLRV
ncbi:MAG: alpha-mannosidase, partial [Oscillospiraceae bacterium]